jgi:hypothetical protein
MAMVHEQMRERAAQQKNEGQNAEQMRAVLGDQIEARDEQKADQGNIGAATRIPVVVMRQIGFATGHDDTLLANPVYRGGRRRTLRIDPKCG